MPDPNATSNESRHPDLNFLQRRALLILMEQNPETSLSDEEAGQLLTLPVGEWPEALYRKLEPKLPPAK